MTTRMIPWDGQGNLPYPSIPWHGTPAEKNELNKALEWGFDGTPTNAGEGAEGAMCRTNLQACHVHASWGGQIYAFHLCGGHDFLCEVDEPGRTLEWTGIAGPHYVTGQIGATLHRTDRLLYARRIRERLIAEEGLLQECSRCKVIYMGVRHDCVVKQEPEEKLPW